ncbi:MAG: hypothetical protein NZ529_01560 [Cytophagaceae bacterium]|nr:hypothetical protein [Cytophagaceae bacterium]MDW8455453.1 hypothetical protein [Cytophagaceae bacterium]
MHHLNGIQAISVVGIIFGVFCQAMLFIIGKKVDTMWALYPTWIAVFIMGTLVRYFSKGDDDHHH